jgi:hypothetical protein
MAEIIVPTLIVTRSACRFDTPQGDEGSFTSVGATSASLQGVSDINGEATYTTVFAFPPSSISIVAAIFPYCAGTNTFTFTTAGPYSVLQSLQAAIAATESATPPTSTTSNAALTSPTMSITPGPLAHHPSFSGIASDALAGIAIGCALAGALLALLAVFLMRKLRHQRTFPPPAGTHAYADAPSKNEVKRKPLHVPVDPPNRSVGLDDDQVGRGVGLDDVENMPEMRVR